MKTKLAVLAALLSQSVLAHPGHGGPEDLAAVGMLIAAAIALVVLLKK